MTMPCSPFLTPRPSFRQVWKPATRVASGRWLAIRSWFRRLQRGNRAITAR